MKITKRQLKKIIREAVRPILVEYERERIEPAPRRKATPTTPGRAKKMLRRSTRRGRYKGEDWVDMIFNAIHRGGFGTAADIVMDAILDVHVDKPPPGAHKELAELLAAARDGGLFNLGWQKIEHDIAVIASDWYTKHFGN